MLPRVDETPVEKVLPGSKPGKVRADFQHFLCPTAPASTWVLQTCGVSQAQMEGTLL